MSNVKPGNKGLKRPSSKEQIKAIFEDFINISWGKDEGVL
jgi:hypothetical protein